ncbi:MAG: hypothetical protein LAT76_02935 [Schleiferiaceae bacterium]|nr:hypothetical protein [Schleiferiaceae bacterium]
MQTILKGAFQRLLSEKAKEKTEHFILWISLVSFVVHIAIIGFVHLDIIPISASSSLLKNPIAAIYTPFSFILIYEVYLLVYYLPKSTSVYVSKQYEIITLIIFRRLFKDLADLNLVADWFQNKSDLQFTFDLITAILLFYLIYVFHVNRKKLHLPGEITNHKINKLNKFINTKKTLATALIPLLFFLSIHSLYYWSRGVLMPSASDALSFKNINNVFFEQFFTVLIVVDVFLLLFSLFHTDEFHRVIRNSAFIISTILLRISFAVEGLINNLLILTAVVFGLTILFIHNKYEKRLQTNPDEEMENEKSEMT